MTAMHKALYRLLLIFLALMLVLLGCDLPNVMGWGPTPTSTTPPTSTVTPTTTPTPTPIPRLLLETAGGELFNGDWDRALSEYHLALAQAIELTEKADAQLGIGTTLLRAGRILEAIQALDLFISSYPDHDHLGRGYLLRAQ